MNPSLTLPSCTSVFQALQVYSLKKLALTIFSRTYRILKTATSPAPSAGSNLTATRNTADNPNPDFVKIFTQAIVHNLFTISSHIPMQLMIQS